MPLSSTSSPRPEMKVEVKGKRLSLPSSAGDEALSAQRDDIHSAIEAVVANQFGFLVKPMGNTKPLQNLRQSYSEGRGIVIPTGNGTFR